MAQADSVQRVRIYLSRDDQWEGGPRYLAILEQLRRGGATGATVLQGLAGFGPGHRSRAKAPDRPDQHQPVVLEWVDRVERVGRLLPLLEELIGDALVTVEAIPVYRATLRARGPFAPDRSVGDLMRRPAPAVAEGAPLSEVLAVFAREQLDVLPVLDQAGILVGLIAGRDLLWRAGLRLPPQLLPLLSPDEGAAVVAPLAGRVAREIMSPEPRSVGLSTAIPQALVTMVEWGYAQLPVVDRDGRLMGLFGQEQALREALTQAATPPDEGAVRDAEAPTPVRLVMQAVAHQIPAAARLDLALAQLLAAPERSLLVVDAGGRLVGAFDLAAALRGLAGDERATLLAALQHSQAAPLAALPGAAQSIDPLITRELPCVGPEDSLLDAARRLLELGLERLAVVDGEARLLGIIGRGGLVRALLQQSE